MVSSAKVREIRKTYAQFQRKHVYWKDAKSRAEMLASRRETREFNNNLFESKAFHRLIDQLGNVDSDGMYDFMLRLRMLKVFLSSSISTKDAKEGRQRYRKAASEVKIAARVLREYARHGAPSDQRAALLHAATQIELRPVYASEDKWESVVWFFNFDLFGQKGDKRAFAIRNLDDLLPTPMIKRDAMIRDFLALIGIKADSKFVRSTLKKGAGKLSSPSMIMPSWPRN